MQTVNPVRDSTLTAVMLAIISILFLLIAILIFYAQSMELATIADWNQVKACPGATAAIAAAGGDCTMTIAARITGNHLADPKPTLDLLVGPTTYTAYLSQGQKASLAGVKTGDSVSIEVWRRRVVLVGEVPTRTNPGYFDAGNNSIVWPIGALVLAAIPLPFLYLTLRKRRRLKLIGLRQGVAES